MDDRCNPLHEPCNMEKQQFADLEKVEGLIPELEEEETLSSKEVALEMLVVVLNWTLFSALITGSIWWFQFIAPQPGSPVNVDGPTHELQTPSLRHTLSRGVFLVGSLLSFCVVLLIVLGKVLMRQHTLTLKLPPYGPRRLPKHMVQRLRAIPTSMPPWFMQLLKSLQLARPCPLSFHSDNNTSDCLFLTMKFMLTFALEASINE
ncbi:hypothetical protein F4604DRAFT_1960369 [Suillus subluteus]|nr:hypothetical protein F4604DRAFT_1960369 [Suillus subluteus]